MNAKIRVQVDKDLADIMPTFLNNRKKDIELITQSLAKNDLASIESVAHKLAGNAGGYGLAELGLIGREMETSAKQKDIEKVNNLFQKMKDYLASLDIEFI
ncbi:MAG: Hpt domain-containing protein [Bdellovibrio sp.]|nr:Hpt domain-containing protein [Bdellovibrio sp.]